MVVPYGKRFTAAKRHLFGQLATKDEILLSFLYGHQAWVYW